MLCGCRRTEAPGVLGAEEKLNPKKIAGSPPDSQPLVQVPPQTHSPWCYGSHRRGAIPPPGHQWGNRTPTGDMIPVGVGLLSDLLAPWRVPLRPGTRTVNGGRPPRTTS
ncbi:unnamed protein product [Boreogadus saida]